MYLPYKFIIALSQMVAMNIWTVVTHVVAMYTLGGCYVHPEWLLCTPRVVAMYTPSSMYICTYVCMRAIVCIHPVCTHVHMYVYPYVRTYVFKSMYVYASR